MGPFPKPVSPWHAEQSLPYNSAPRFGDEGSSGYFIVVSDNNISDSYPGGGVISSANEKLQAESNIIRSKDKYRKIFI
jgi:hypothetical protein